MTNPVFSIQPLTSPPFIKVGAGTKFLEPAPNFVLLVANVLASAPNFIKGGGGADVKGCMLNTGVGHSPSAM